MASFSDTLSRRLSTLGHIGMADNITFYEYEIIGPDEIRIVTLHPGGEQDDICISIATRKIDQTSEHAYAAISYVWGSAKLSRQVQCNGATLMVTSNVLEVLQRLRHRKNPTFLWIDAICINQKDLPERNHQVSLMKYIYSSALQVLIWTGKGDPDTPSVFSSFKSIARNEEAWLKKPKTKSLLQISEFIGKPGNWFHRAWCFQEVCLAKDAQVLCGKHQLPWSTIARAFKSLESHGLSQYVFGNIADCLAASSHLYVGAPEREQPYLATLLPLTRNLEATDPRDKLFAMLGLVETCFLGGVKPDYTRSVADVYSSYTCAMIAQEQGLSVFSSVMGSRQGQDLPSWVPDWRLPRETAYLHGYDWPTTTKFYDLNQGIPISCHFESGAEGQHLVLDGAYIGTVTLIQSGNRLLRALKPALSMSVDPVEGWNNLFPPFSKLFKSLDLKGTYTQTGESSKMALLRTISANHLPEPNRIRSFVEETLRTIHMNRIDRYRWLDEHPRLKAYTENPKYKEYTSKIKVGESTTEDIDPFLFLCQMALDVLDFKLPRPGGSFFGTIEQRIFGSKESYSIMDYIASMVRTFLTGRVVFKTNNGLVGIGPDYMAVGDQVCDLLGGSVPFILRKRSDDTKKEFILIGECYVHGIMNGEIWKTPAADSPPTIDGRKLNFEKVKLV